MSKVITVPEAFEIVSKLEQEIDDIDQYASFLAGLGDLIGDHTGAFFKCVSPDDGEDSLKHCLHFENTDSTPEDGGIFEHYDTDVIWKDGEEL